MPHCVGLRIGADDGACVVYDTDGAYKQSRSAFEQAVDAGMELVQHVSIFGFWTNLSTLRPSVLTSWTMKMWPRC